MLALYVAVTTGLAVLAIAALVGAAGLLIALSAPAGRSRLRQVLEGQERHPIAWGAVVALVAMSGSLYFSEIAHLTPCALCWYQRIAMYPLVVLLGVATIRGDAGIWRYVLPLAAIGLVIAVYHVTIEWRPALDVGMCSTGVPCSVRYFAVFGFVSIATMSACAFLLIIALMTLLRTLERAEAPA